MHLRRVGRVERHAQRQAVGDHEFLEDADGDAGKALSPARAVQADFLRQRPKVLDEPLSPVNRSGDVRGREDHVGHVLAQAERREQPALPVAQGVDQAEGDVREAQPIQVGEGGERRILPGAAAPRAGDFSRQRLALEGDKQDDDQPDQQPQQPLVDAQLTVRRGEPRHQQRRAQHHDRDRCQCDQHRQRFRRTRSGQAIIGIDEAHQRHAEHQQRDHAEGQPIRAIRCLIRGAGEPPASDRDRDCRRRQDEIAVADRQRGLQAIDQDHAGDQQRPTAPARREQRRVDQRPDDEDQDGEEIEGHLTSPPPEAETAGDSNRGAGVTCNAPTNLTPRPPLRGERGRSTGINADERLSSANSIKSKSLDKSTGARSRW